MDIKARDKEYVVITTENFPKGGAGASFLDLFCRGVVNGGGAIKVLLLKGLAFGDTTYRGKRNNYTDYGVEYRYLGLRNRPRNVVLKLIDEFVSFVSLFVSLARLTTRRKSITIMVYSYDIQFNILIYSFSKVFRLEVVTFVSEYFIREDAGKSIFEKIRWYGFLINLKYFFRGSSKLLVFSTFLKEYYLRLGVSQNDIIVLPNLTDFEYWECSETEPRYTVGYSGTPSAKDGLPDLFKAIGLLKVMQVNVTLLVVGDSPFGKSLIPGLSAEIEKLGLTGNVQFTGLVDKPAVKTFLSACRILAITRQNNIRTAAGFPTKLGEYFALRKPVLSTDFGDVPRYFNDNEHIFLAECGNAESIAKKLKWIIENEEKSRIVAAAGYNKAKELLDFNNAVARVLSEI